MRLWSLHWVRGRQPSDSRRVGNHSSSVTSRGGWEKWQQEEAGRVSRRARECLRSLLCSVRHTSSIRAAVLLWKFTVELDRLFCLHHIVLAWFKPCSPALMMSSPDVCGAWLVSWQTWAFLMLPAHDHITSNNLCIPRWCPFTYPWRQSFPSRCIWWNGSRPLGSWERKGGN